MKRQVVALCALVLLASCARGENRGSPADPDVTVMVTMRDDNTYEPSEIEVEEGQTVRFVVANDGAVRHEFLIGTPAEHEDHETQMQESGAHGGEHGGMLPGVSLDPGDEQDFTYTFDSSKRLIYGCHEPGHFQAGMKGEFRYRD